jgi:putative antitoxin of VapBC-like toxin-antitoxin system
MRTTVVLKDELVVRARKLAGEKTLSGLINRCLADWIARHDRGDIERRLAEEYRAGEADSRRVRRSFEGIDREGWPSW